MADDPWKSLTRDTAACLVDRVLPDVPVSQWVLSLPIQLRWRLAYDKQLTTDVLGVFLRAVYGWYHRQGRESDLEASRCGSVTFVQRFGSALNCSSSRGVGRPSPQEVNPCGAPPASACTFARCCRWGVRRRQRRQVSCRDHRDKGAALARQAWVHGRRGACAQPACRGITSAGTAHDRVASNGSTTTSSSFGSSAGGTTAPRTSCSLPWSAAGVNASGPVPDADGRADRPLESTGSWPRWCHRPGSTWSATMVCWRPTPDSAPKSYRSQCPRWPRSRPWIQPRRTRRRRSCAVFHGRSC